MTWAAVVAAAMIAPAGAVVVPIPDVHATTASYTVERYPRVLVESLAVSGPSGAVRITCGGCRRLRGPIRRSVPGPGSLRLAGVDGLPAPGHDVAVRTYRPGALGRYELLAAAADGRGLVFRSSGCLGSLGRPTPCPAGVGTPLAGPPVSGPQVPAAPGGGAPRTTIRSGQTGTPPVSFTYASSATASTFQCQLDAGGWLACPAGGISYGAVAPGSHTFSVRADLGGLVDPAPPERTWTQAAPSPAPGSSAPGGTTLVAGQYVASPNAQYRLVMQDDGNLVLYTQGRVLWSTGTAGHPGATAAFQPDGNLVVYGTDGRALWSAGSEGHPGSTLAVQDDGDVVVYAPAGVAVWNTATFTDTMTPGAGLVAGQYLRSANAECQLLMQAGRRGGPPGAPGPPATRLR